MVKKRTLKNLLKFQRLLSITFLVLAMAACSGGNNDIPVETFADQSYQPFPTDMPEISAIEGNADIVFPPSAHEIYAYTTGFREIFIAVRFSMQSSELPVFMETTLCNQPLKNVTSLETLSTDPKWWTPNQGKEVQDCYGENEHSHQHVIIDMSDKDIYIVYVSNSTY